MGLYDEILTHLYIYYNHIYNIFHLYIQPLSVWFLIFVFELLQPNIFYICIEIYPFYLFYVTQIQLTHVFYILL